MGASITSRRALEAAEERGAQFRALLARMTARAAAMSDDPEVSTPLHPWTKGVRVVHHHVLWVIATGYRDKSTGEPYDLHYCFCGAPFRRVPSD